MTRRGEQALTVEQLAREVSQTKFTSRHDPAAEVDWLAVVERTPAHRTVGGEDLVYSHRLFTGYCLARASLLLVDKDTWREDTDPKAYLVEEYSVATGQPKTYETLQSSVDNAPRLWAQIMDQDYPASRSGAKQAPAYAQRRVEAKLDKNYHASEARLNLGLSRLYEFVDIVGLEAMIRRVQLQQPKEAGQAYVQPAA